MSEITAIRPPTYPELLTRYMLERAQNIYDKMTGLIWTTGEGRGLILVRIHQALGDKNIIVVKLDLRGFGMINNQYSHETGDEVLKTVAQALWSLAGENGLALRSHDKGDELGLVLTNEDVRRVRRKLRTLQKNGIDWCTEEGKGKISFTMGLSHTGEIEEPKDFEPGDLFQLLWNLASKRERREHRSKNG